MRYILLLSLLLTSCIASQPPAYFVGVGNDAPRCGGYAIGPHLALTAEHCVNKGFTTVFAGGKANQGRVAARWPEIDLALLETEQQIQVARYASLIDNYVEFGSLYGFCPLRIPGRMVIPATPIDWGARPFCATWQVVGWIACSGDSGGVVDQDGRMAGMLVAIADWGIDEDLVEGDIVCVVPASLIRERLQQARAN